MKKFKIYMGIVAALLGASTVNSQSTYKPGYKLIFNDEFSATEFDNNTPGPSNGKWQQKTYASTDMHQQFWVGDGHLDSVSCDIFQMYKDAVDSTLRLTMCSETPPQSVRSDGPNMIPGSNAANSCKVDLWQDAGEGIGVPECAEEYKYVSGRFESYQKFQYGYFEIKCKMPKDKCFWEAFWMWSANNPCAGGTNDPDGGNWYNEIDVFEMHDEVDNSVTPNVYDGSVLSSNWHWRKKTGPGCFDNTMGGEFSSCGDDTETEVNSEFHTYGLEWTPNYIAWFKDGERIRVRTCNKYFPRHPMVLLVSWALRNHTDQDTNGNRLSNNDIPPPFPMDGEVFEIDHVRVYKKQQVNNYGAGSSAGGWHKSYHRRIMADVNGDGLDDIVGFGWNHVSVSIARLLPVNTSSSSCMNASSNKIVFDPPENWINGFTYAQGWRNHMHQIEVIDVNNDGSADIVGFGNSGVSIAFGPTLVEYYTLGYKHFTLQPLVVNNFGYNAGGWRLDKHPRFVVDVNGDGMKDIVGCGASQVYVSLANSAGTSWGTATPWITGFCYAQGWRVNEHDRYFEDIDGDGDADIVGFGNSGVTTSKSSGTSFGSPVLQLSGFGNDPLAGGWNKLRHRRMMTDISGDGRADIVGFGENDVWISSAGPTGNFSTPIAILNDFCYSQGYRVDEHEIYLRDIGGPAAPWKEIVAFFDDGVHAATIDTDPSTKPFLWRNYYGNDNAAGAFDPARHIRTLGDCNGDGQADIVCFAEEGVMISPSSYCFYPTNIDEIDPVPPARLGRPETVKEPENNPEEQVRFSAKLVPNPSNGIAMIVLEGYQKNATGGITVTDLSGRIIWKQEMLAAKNPLDISKAENGVYVVQIIANGQIETLKLIKQ